MRGLPHRSALVFALVLSSAADGDSITLRPKAEVPVDVKEVRLRDVATLDGAEAMRYADLVVAPAPSAGRPRIVLPHDVRSRLDAAGVRWDLVDFNGGRVFVQFEPADRAKGEVPQAVGAAKAVATPPVTPVATPAPVPPAVPTSTPAAEPAPAPPTAAVPVIRPDDRVTVLRELGSISIPMAAIALDGGAPGETIRLQYVDRRNRRDPRTFTAMVTGPGAATVR